MFIHNFLKSWTGFSVRTPLQHWVDAIKETVHDAALEQGLQCADSLRCYFGDGLLFCFADRWGLSSKVLSACFTAWKSETVAEGKMS